MRILVLSLESPYPALDGTRMFIYQRLRHLARDNDVHLLLGGPRSRLAADVLEHLEGLVTLHFVGNPGREFPHDDAEWTDIARYLVDHVDDDAVILAPREFREIRAGVVGYHDATFDTDDLYAVVVLNRSMIGNLPPTTAQRMAQTLRPVRANARFIVMSKHADEHMPANGHAAGFLAAIGRRAAEMEREAATPAARALAAYRRLAGDPPAGASEAVAGDPAIVRWLREHGGTFDAIEFDDSTLSTRYLAEPLGTVKALNIHADEIAKAWRVAKRLRPVKDSLAAARSIIGLRHLYRQFCSRAHVCITLTDEDHRRMSRFGRHHATRFFRGGIGVDRDHYDFSFDPQAPRGACFVGTMNYAPNADAVTWFVRRVLPRVRRALPTFTLTIVGTRPTEAVMSLRKVPGVEVTGAVPDTRPHVRRAGITVLPIRTGGGISNKLLQSLSMGVPVVTFAENVRGLSIRNGHEALVVNGAAAMTRAIVRLAGDTALRRRLADAGRAYVERHHDWRRIMDRYQRELQAAVDARITR